MAVVHWKSKRLSSVVENILTTLWGMDIEQDRQTFDPTT